MTKKIGLLTLPLHTNYGGILQILALQQHLQELGHATVLLERDSKGPLKNRFVIWAANIVPSAFLKNARLSDKTNKPKRFWDGFARFKGRIRQRQMRTVHAAFIKQYFPTRSGLRYSSDGMRKAVQDFKLNAAIVGSDQVWRLSYQPHDCVGDYFLEFVGQPTVKRISYAASFGNSDWVYSAETQHVKECLSRFDAVSVRERSGVSICQNTFERDDAQMVLDPTMLVEPAFYETVMSPSRSDETQTTLLTYVLDFDADHPDLDETVAKHISPDCVVQSLVLDGAQKMVSIPTWLRAFKDADYVLTDSFHGMVFSILFKKNFIAIVNKKRGADRFVSLLSQLGLEDRLVNNDDVGAIPEKMQQPIDYEAVESRLNTSRAASKQFLANALA